VVIDIHGHLGNINFAPFWAADAAQLEKYADDAGVDCLCVSSARSIMYDTTEGNVELNGALAKTTKLLGYVTVNPLFPRTIDDLDLVDDNPKFIGAKVHPDYHGYEVGSKMAREFLDRVAGRVPTMLFHVSCMPGTGFADAGAIVDFAERHPRTNIIMAHMAGIFQNPVYPYFPNLRGLEMVAKRGLDNVYVDTAHYLMYVYPGVMEKMVDLLGPDHIVFGTDVPLQGPVQMRFAIEIIRALKISDSEKKRILGGNAKKFIRTGGNGLRSESQLRHPELATTSDHSRRSAVPQPLGVAVPLRAADRS
jgi:predicted TIM-barrel fold metal-dependent hydrolase